MSDGRPYLQASSAEPTYIDFVMATMLGILMINDNRGGNSMDIDSRVFVSGTYHNARKCLDYTYVIKS